MYAESERDKPQTAMTPLNVTTHCRLNKRRAKLSSCLANTPRKDVVEVVEVVEVF